jgi:beta-lactamase class A
VKLRWSLFGLLSVALLSIPAEAARLTVWQFSAQQNRLDIRTDVGTQPKAQLVLNPTRIVVDLPGIRWGKPKASQWVTSEAVKAIRVGQFNAQTTRLVIELAPGYSLDPDKVIVQGRSETNWSLTLPRPQRNDSSVTELTSANPIPLRVMLPPSPPPITYTGLVPVGQPMNWLQQRLSVHQTSYPAFRSTSMYFLDVDTGNYADLGGDRVFPAASIIKLPILIAFFQAVDAGTVSLDETLVMRPELIASGSGEMQFLRAWSKFSALHTVSQMITISDNTATNMIIKRLGGASVLNQKFRQWGLPNTRIRNWLPDLGGTNTITAKEMVRLMVMLDKGNVLSPKSRTQALGILQRVKNRKLLAAGIGPGAVIAHKTGDIGFMLGDAGMVVMPSGKRYMAAVLAKTPYDDPAGWDFVKGASKIVYTYLSQPMQTAADSSGADPVAQSIQLIP